MKNVIVIVPRHHKESSADLYEQGRGEIPTVFYEHIELDKFKTIYKRKEVLGSLNNGWTILETTDLASILILRVMRLKKEVDKLVIISNEGRDEINEDGRHLGTTSECERLLDWALGELVAGKAK